MKLIQKSLVAAACAATLLSAGSAFAGGSTTVDISGNVLPTCVFTGGPYAIPFGTLDPSRTTDATASTTIGYQCTNGTAASSVLINTAASPTTVNITRVGGTETLPVSLAWTVPATLGTGIGSAFPAITFPVNGTIPVASINAAVAGTYLASYAVALLP